MGGRNINSRRRRNIHKRVYVNSEWRCEMPVCLAPSRAIDRVLLGVDDPWAPSIDHVVPLFEGGRDMESNMRAAHKLCNNHAARRSGQSIARLCPGLGELLEKITRNS